MPRFWSLRALMESPAKLFVIGDNMSDSSHQIEQESEYSGCPIQASLDWLKKLFLKIRS